MTAHGSGSKGVLLALASGASFGAAVPVSRLAMDAGVGVLTLAALRFVLLAALLFAWQLARRRLRTLGPRDLGEIAAMGLLTGVITCANLMAIRHIPVTTATLVFYTYPLMTLALSVAAFGERVSPDR